MAEIMNLQPVWTSRRVTNAPRPGIRSRSIHFRHRNIELTALEIVGPDLETASSSEHQIGAPSMLH